ncbi:hypothetical protein D3C72_2063530 [compost metagenome]
MGSLITLRNCARSNELKPTTQRTGLVIRMLWPLCARTLSYSSGNNSGVVLIRFSGTSSSLTSWNGEAEPMRS